eukprot:scaffold50088_cov49-Cyclotella_meneghiniana.AAC.1
MYYGSGTERQPPPRLTNNTAIAFNHDGHIHRPRPATTSHYQPPGRRILSTTYPSTIDNVYLAHRLLFATNSCHRPTPFRTSSPSHITSSVIATIFIAANHLACHTNRKILQCCNIEPPFGVNETSRGRITGLHDSKCTNEYTTTQNGGGLKWIQ